MIGGKLLSEQPIVALLVVLSRIDCLRITNITLWDFGLEAIMKPSLCSDEYKILTAHEIL